MERLLDSGSADGAGIRHIYHGHVFSDYCIRSQSDRHLSLVQGSAFQHSIVPFSKRCVSRRVSVDLSVQDCSSIGLDLVAWIPRTLLSLRKAPLPRLLLNNVSCMRNGHQILRHTNVSLHDGSALVLSGYPNNSKLDLHNIQITRF
ncbi:uncharacterized protein LOC117933426 [Vitis riparia]|uniref:uncharacterized protein LOC117933426 n=1 Tax=Vitis riparia TaxID=96939 RepID=UPI00155ABDAC|nr:uncharacterized protein LOC117933426 [Vitis riparia]